MHGDPLWMKGLLAIHIAAGALCVVLVPLVLAVTKGGRRHRRWGKIYVSSMGVVAVTALPMALFRPVLFLALVAVLSFYLAFSGYRVLGLKNLASGGHAGAIDWIAAVVTFAACAGLAGVGLAHLDLLHPVNVAAIVFGVLGMRATAMDVYRFVHKPAQPMFWLFVHFEKLIASYIAAMTAFSLVTLSQYFPHAGLVLWLWPTAVGVPAILATVAYYKRKTATNASRLAPITR